MQIGNFQSVAFSPDGTRFVGGGWRGAAVVWDVQSRKVLAKTGGRPDKVISIGFRDNRPRILTSAQDNSFSYWNLPNDRKTLALGRDEIEEWPLNFSADGKLIATSCSDQSINLWDGDLLKKLRVLKVHAKWNSCAAFSSDDKQIITNSSESTAALWDVRSGQQLLVFDGHKGHVNSAAVSIDGKLIVTGSDDKTRRRWDSHTGERLYTLGSHDDWVHDVAFSPDGTLVMTSDGRKVFLWDTQSGRKLRVFDVFNLRYGFAQRLAFSPDSKQIAIAVTGDGGVVLCDVQSGAMIREFDGRCGEIEKVAFSQDGRLLLTADNAHTTSLWNVATKTLLVSVISLNDGKDWLAYTPDGHFDGSEGGGKLVTFRVTGKEELVPGEQMAKEFYRPGLLGQILTDKHAK